MIKKLSVLIVFLCITAANLIGQSIFTGFGFWHTSSNWSLNMVPAANESVLISGPCVVASNETCKDLFLIHLGSLTIETNGELTVNGPIYLSIVNNLVINGKLILLGDIHLGQIKRIDVNGGLECFSSIELP